MPLEKTVEFRGRYSTHMGELDERLRIVEILSPNTACLTSMEFCHRKKQVLEDRVILEVPIDKTECKTSVYGRLGALGITLYMFPRVLLKEYSPHLIRDLQDPSSS